MGLTITIRKPTSIPSSIAGKMLFTKKKATSAPSWGRKKEFARRLNNNSKGIKITAMRTKNLAV